MSNERIRPLRQAPRPQDMSQLDYLWTYFGPYSVSELVSNPPAEDRILTEAAVADYINKSIGGSKVVVKLEIVQKEGVEFKDKLELRGKNGDGDVITFVDLEKDTKITEFKQFLSTQADVDNGNANKVGELWLVLKDSTGQEFYVNLASTQYIGQETDSMVISVIDSKIAGQLKINNPIINRSIDITSTPNGIRADLVIDPDTKSSVTLHKTNKGVSCSYKWQDTETEIRFKSLTYNQYLMLSKLDNGTLYFITDLPCIYFMGIKYASSTSLVDYFTKDEVNELLEKRVPWVEVSRDGVKVNDIVTENNASVSGTDTSGNTFNLAMLSRLDKIEIGSDGKILNLNGSDPRPTYNGDELALLDDVDEVANTFGWIDVN